MIEGGGLGVFTPEEVGPIDVQTQNGVVDVRVADEAEAVRVGEEVPRVLPGPARRLDLRRSDGAAPAGAGEPASASTRSGRSSRRSPTTGSVLELRPRLRPGIVTALVRIEGRPLGAHRQRPDPPRRRDRRRRGRQGRALHPALRRVRPPDRLALRHARLHGRSRRPRRRRSCATSRACSSPPASLTVPFFTVVLRKGYGLGAQAMAGGHFHAPFFTVAWPTGEFGGMGLEGAVRLGYRKELEAIDDPAEREGAVPEAVVATPTSAARRSTWPRSSRSTRDRPADTRHWIVRGLRTAPPPHPRRRRKRPCIDAW